MPVAQNRIQARRNSVGTLKDHGSHKVEHFFDQLFTIRCSRKTKLRGVIELNNNE